MNVHTTQTDNAYDLKKQASKYATILANGANDHEPNSGIQVWSRQQVITNEDCYQLGYVYGSNSLPYEVGSKQAETARHIAGMIEYRHGYMNGIANHRPFTAAGELKWSYPRE